MIYSVSRALHLQSVSRIKSYIFTVCSMFNTIVVLLWTTRAAVQTKACTEHNTHYLPSVHTNVIKFDDFYAKSLTLIDKTINTRLIFEHSLLLSNAIMICRPTTIKSRTKIKIWRIIPIMYTYFLGCIINRSVKIITIKG